MSLIAELKRRNVFRVAAAYVVVAWLTIQVIDVLVQLMGVPEWIGRALVLVLVVAFPVALVLAWAFEVTSDGVKREHEVDRSESITHATGRKLDFIIICVLMVAVVIFAIDKFYISLDTETPMEDASFGAVSLSNLAASSRQTVAVVPFVDMSPSQDQGWIGETIATELQTQLSKRSDLQILSRSSSFAIPDEARSSKEIGQFLSVDLLVEGTVRRMGDRIRVTVQLVSVLDGYQMWSDVYESRLRDDFSAEVAVAEFFSSQVRAQLAAPFTPNVQLVGFAQATESSFENLFATPPTDGANEETTSESDDGESDEE